MNYNMHLVQDNVFGDLEMCNIKRHAEIFHNEHFDKAVVYDNLQEYKYAYDAKHLTGALRLVQERLTGMGARYLENFLGRPVLTDPNGRGCGLHVLPTHGFLDLHYDGNWHPELEALRIASLVYYVDGPLDSVFVLNDMRIPFRTNRLVLFSTDNVLHGVPEPQSAPRYTLSSFYYIRAPKPLHPRRAFFPNATPSTRAKRAAL